MTKLQKIIDSHRKLVMVVSFAFIVCMQCCVFPFYNFSHRVQFPIELINFMVAIGICKCAGDLETMLFPNGSWVLIILLNLGLTLSGMGARYLLEYGEVSNTYNFTIRNMLFHIVMMVLWSSRYWKHRIKEKHRN